MITPVELSGYGSTITLTVPEFGDSLEIEHHRIARQSRAGDRIIFRDPNWPRKYKLKFVFENLSQDQCNALLTFVNNTLGKDIILTDHNGVDWEGIIINPELEVQQTSRNECGGFETEIEFEGAMV